MNCEQCREHLLGFAWDELPPQLHDQVADALARCPDCQRELARIQHVRAAWQDAAPAQELSHLTRADLLRQARLHADTLQARNTSPLARLSAWLMHPAVASVAAVAILILVALLFTQQNQGEERAASFATAPAAEEAKTEELAAAPPPAELPAAAAPTLDGQLMAQRDEAEGALERPPEPSARAESPLPQQRKLSLRADEPAPKEEAAKANERGLSYGNVADLDSAAYDKKADEKNAKDAAPAKADPAVALAESAPLTRSNIGNSAAGAAEAQNDQGDQWTQKQSAFNNSGSSLGAGGGGSLSGLSPGAAPTDDAQQGALPPQERFQQGMSRFNRADYAGAIEDFNAFMNEAPASSDYHGLALYHRGMSEHRQANYTAAAASFRKVIADHPKSEKRDEARYWLALSLQKINPDDEEARTILTDLSQGRGGVAAQARENLERAYGRQRSTPAKPAAKGKKESNYDYLDNKEAPAESKSAE